ncbi:uncharacterized protein LOC107636143 [Arachis ipaensis]|uniref:uncharacterized protein LOC107636143 n=1 Tax=Arachis ipaensis TaxID=130454 RepID=UPI000A2B1F58|nr:uncharacterized protein LOC107636143 [Arachis ipaensis]
MRFDDDSDGNDDGNEHGRRRQRRRQRREEEAVMMREREWVKAVPLIEARQNEVIDFIKEYIIHQFGIPQTLSTDQGTMFTGQRIKNFAASRNINMVTSTLYYAQANGQVEAANKILINLIKKQIGRKPRTCHETLSQVLWAYRNSPRGSTGISPYKLVYGHDVVLPLKINRNTLRILRQDDLPIEYFWNTMYDELSDLSQERVLALENMVRQKDNIAQNYNRRIKERCFSMGELVLKRIKDIDSGNVIKLINEKYLKQYRCMKDQD